MSIYWCSFCILFPWSYKSEKLLFCFIFCFCFEFLLLFLCSFCYSCCVYWFFSLLCFVYAVFCLFSFLGFFPFFFLFCIKKNNNDIHLLKKNACLGNVPIVHSSDTRNKETGIYRYIISFNSAIYGSFCRNHMYSG